MSDEYYRDKAKSFADKAKERISEGGLTPFKRRHISDLFFSAGKDYQNAGDLNEARNAYLKSGAYAPSPTYTHRAKNAIASLEQTEEKYSLKEKRNLGGIERKVNLTPKQQRALDKSKKEKSFSELLEQLRKNAEDFPTSNYSLFSIMSVVTLLASLFFVSSSLTGFAVSNFTTNDLQWAGLCFFVCGLVFAFLFLRKKYSIKK